MVEAAQAVNCERIVMVAPGALATDGSTCLLYTSYQKTDAEYVRDLTRLAGRHKIAYVVVDPSAASFIEALRRAGY